MNSVTRYLSPATIAATLFAMRSGKKEFLLVVEGDTDVDLFSRLFSLSHSNIVSTRGKENLTAVYNLAPRKGIDDGTIFFRDRDHDQISHQTQHGVSLYVTDLYDIEMHLLVGRIYSRIYREYVKGFVADTAVQASFDLILEVAAWIGALRCYAALHGIALDFDDLKHNRFLDFKTMKANLHDLIVYVYAKSKIPLTNVNNVGSDVSNIFKNSGNSVFLTCSKDFFEVMHIGLHRYYQACASSECEPTVLMRTLRIAALLDDIKSASFYPILSQQIAAAKYQWTGCQL